MRVTPNLKLGVTELGNRDGRTIFVTHGWGTDHNFMLCFKDLFPDYRILLADMPGYGKSRHLKQFAGYPGLTGQLILNTIPHNSILLSWSLSTLSGIEASCMDKEHKIDRFISVCGTPRFPCDPNWPGFDYKYVLRCQQLFSNPKNQRLLKLFFIKQTQCSTLPKDQCDNFIKAYENMLPVDMEVLHKGLMCMAHYDLREALFSIKVPCLHLFGAKDRLVKVESASCVIDLPYHNTAILHNSAHMPFLSEPDEFKRVINLFLNSSYLK